MAALHAQRDTLEDTTSIEVDFATATPQEIRRLVLEHGGCILRNAIPAETVHRYANMVEECYDAIRHQKKDALQHKDLDNVHIRDEHMVSRHGAEHSLFNVLEGEKFKAVLAAVFGDGNYYPFYEESYGRSIDGRKGNRVISFLGRLNALLHTKLGRTGVAISRLFKPLHTQLRLVDERQGKRDATSFIPLHIHIDGLYHHNPDRFSLNFWVPFDECGKGTEAPGFALYPAGYKDVRACIGYSTWPELQRQLHYLDEPTQFAASPMSMRTLMPILKKMFAAKNIPLLTPHFRPGDVMLINNWTPHGSYYAPGMSKHRRSLEVRYYGAEWNPIPA